MEVLKDKNIWEKLILISRDAIFKLDSEGFIMDVNEVYIQLMQYDNKEIVGQHFNAFVHSEDQAETPAFGQEELSSGIRNNSFENRHIQKSGGEVYFTWSWVWSEEEGAVFCIGRDITELQGVREKLREKDELYYTFIEHGADMLSLFDEELNYIYCEESVYRELGYKPEQLIGASAWNFIHQADIPGISEVLSRGLATTEKINIPEFRFKDAAGNWRWLEARGSNQLHNPSIGALIVSARDVTEKVYRKHQLQESEQRFKALFEADADLIAYISEDGIIKDVNPAAISFLGEEKHEIVNRPVSDFLPPEKLSHIIEYRKEALQGKQVNFEIELAYAGSEPRTYDVKNIPVTVNNEIVGIYTIARDITAAKRYQKIIKKQAKKLNTIFESITDAFFTLDKQWNFSYINTECERLLQTGREDLIGKNIWEIFPEGINGGAFFYQFSRAFKTGKSVHFEAYSKRIGKWLQVKAYPSKEGLSVYMDNITERVKAEQELEKLAMVARKTINGVVFTDAAGRTEWVNEGFTKITGYTFAEVAGKYPGVLLIGEETDKATARRIEKGLKQNKPFREEILGYKKSGEKMWLALDFTPILNEAGEVIRFIALQTDITFRKKAELQQLQLTEDLYKRNSDLQQFTYIVSHNLRAPITAAMGLVDLLTIQDRNSTHFDTLLDHLNRSVYKIDTVLKDLQKILSARDNKDVIKESVELAPLCQQVIEEQAELLKKYGGQVSLNIEEGISVLGSKAYLYSIFQNLLSNAIKYRSPERPLKVAIQCFSNEGGGVSISFSDNGSGFDIASAGEDLFKLYKRFHNHVEGRGIGLHLIKKHVESMDGHIEVESKVNRGTKFSIYLNKA